MNSNRIFKTTNRKLEQFLHMHRIAFVDQCKSADGMNEWFYAVTPDFVKVYQEYRELYINNTVSK